MERAASCVAVIVLGCGFVLGQATEKVLYSFSGPPDGGNPSASPLVSDRAGNLYGITSFGGTQNGGTIFELSPSSDGIWSEVVLYSFCASGYNCPAGSGPAGLTIDRNGNLFGTASYGGTNGGGVLFELSPPSVFGGTWNYSVLYNFEGQAFGVPIFDESGNVYGTTMFGPGTLGQGDIWELSPRAGGWTETVLYASARR